MSKYTLTEEDLKNHIKGVAYQRYGDTGVLCVITMLNGYTVTGQSACIDPNIFDEEIGKKIAYANAFEKLWQVLGYGLKQRWYHETQLTWLDRVKNELADLDEKRAKLSALLAGERPLFISEEEWERLKKQDEAMSAYAFILSDRIINAEK